MRAAIYCRVSTDNQEREGTSLDTQLDACLRYCQSKGYHVEYRYSEAYSGLTLDRPKLNELRELVRNKQIGVLVVYCLDRLTRNPNHGIILTEQLEKTGVVLEAVSESIESSDLGRLISYIRGFASKLEADKIKERTGRGKMAKARGGSLPVGCGVGLYGYAWDKATKKRTIIQSEALVVNRIFEMVANRKTRHQVACVLNRENVPTKSNGKWHPVMIDRIVSNQEYLGISHYGKTKSNGNGRESTPKEVWVALPNTTPPITTQEIFDRAAQAINDSKFIKARPIHEYALTGFATCASCGSSLCGRCSNRGMRYYRCQSTASTSTKVAQCHERSIHADELEGKVWAEVEKVFANSHLLIENFRNPSNLAELEFNKENLIKRLNELASQESRLVSLFRLSAVDESVIKTQMKTIESDRYELKSQQKAIDDVLNKVISEDMLLGLVNTYVDEVKSKYGSGSFLDKRMVLKSMGVWVEASRTMTRVSMQVKIDGVELERVVEL